MRSAAHKRLIFDELFYFELAMALKHKGNILEEGIAFRTEGELSSRFLSILPFGLTEAQKRVIGEIHGDMARPSPMHRLLQGDVGSGKTVVSMAAMLTACENGYQAAIMAPTEILAEQHYRNIARWVESLGLRAVLLLGSTRPAEKKEVVRQIENGEIQFVVGTHALIQEGVEFRKLGLVVVDEQHRFGVVQRAALRAKGSNPDVLVMTATPIPRTLAMTVYGDLDISVLDEMPPGKKPVKTKVFFEKERPRVYEIVRKEIVKGNQVFIVYPLVTESEALDLKDATRMAEHLQKDVFPELRIGLVHGRMKGPEKDGIMKAFNDRQARHPGIDHRDRGRDRHPPGLPHGDRTRRALRPRTASPAPGQGRPQRYPLLLCPDDRSQRVGKRPQAPPDHGADHMTDSGSPRRISRSAGRGSSWGRVSPVSPISGWPTSFATEGSSTMPGRRPSSLSRRTRASSGPSTPR